MPYSLTLARRSVLATLVAFGGLGLAAGCGDGGSPSAPATPAVDAAPADGSSATAERFTAEDYER